MELVIIVVAAMVVLWMTGLFKLAGQSVDSARDLASNRIEVISFESDIRKARDMSKAHTNMGEALIEEYSEAQKAAKSLRGGLKSISEAE